MPTDLSADWAGPLADAGFDATQPTVWLLEGPLIYLTADEATRLLSTVTDLSAAGSRVAFAFDTQD